MELQARLLPKPATFLHPESQEMGAGAGQSISRPQPSLKAVWWEKSSTGRRSQGPACSTHEGKDD